MNPLSRDHSRTFGRNMRPTLALGPSPAPSQMSVGSIGQWDMVKEGEGDLSAAGSQTQMRVM